jgi:phenylacetate-CoA ligase
MRISEHILRGIQNNPNWLNSCLLKLNIWPEKVYGKSYLLNKKGEFGFNVEERLLEVVNTAIVKVPYYQKRYKEVNSLSEFNSNIGFIDKTIVVENFDLFLSQTIDQNQYVFGTTGGTSGKPLKFLIPKNRHVIELATMHNIWNRTGWNYNTRAVLRNNKLSKNRVYLINPITKEIIFEN